MGYSIEGGIKESISLFGNFCEEKRDLTRRLVVGNQRGSGDFNLLRALWGFTKNASMRRNAKGTIDRLHSAQAENAATQLTSTQTVGIVNGQFQSIRGQNEDGATGTIRLEET